MLLAAGTSLLARDEEGIIERISFIPNRHLTFLHRFEQSTLDFGRRPVDFICQNKISEYWAFFYMEITFTLVVDECANQIRGQEVGCDVN